MVVTVANDTIEHPMHGIKCWIKNNKLNISKLGTIIYFACWARLLRKVTTLLKKKLLKHVNSVTILLKLQQNQLNSVLAFVSVCIKKTHTNYNFKKAMLRGIKVNIILCLLKMVSVELLNHLKHVPAEDESTIVMVHGFGIILLYKNGVTA